MGFPSKRNELGCHFLLQGIFPTLGSNPHVLLGSTYLTTEPWTEKPGRPWGHKELNRTEGLSIEHVRTFLKPRPRKKQKTKNYPQTKD